MHALRLAVAALVAGPFFAAQAACLTDAEVSAMAEALAARTPAVNPKGLNEADAACSRAKLLTQIAARHGAVAGYKAGLTNPAVQKRFNHDRPVWGVLYRSMLLPAGASVEAGFGARPLYEADLLVRVKSASINQAKTPMDVLDAIDQVIPFIELPDLVVQAPPQLDGHAISAINVGARLGVVGTPIPVPSYRAERFALLDGLRDMAVVMNDTQGAELARGKGSDVLGHPLNAVVWLAGALAKEGQAMKPGDLISVGSFSPLLPPRAGLGVTVNYLGLPGAAPVSVSFR
jgi:2-keto-4-pentenoate hydratase